MLVSLKVLLFTIEAEDMTPQRRHDTSLCGPRAWTRPHWDADTDETRSKLKDNLPIYSYTTILGYCFLMMPRQHRHVSSGAAPWRRLLLRRRHSMRGFRKACLLG